VTRTRRARAIAALEYVPSPTAREFLVALVADKKKASDGPDVIDVANAASALSPYGRQALTVVLPLLAHVSADIRQSTAYTLDQIHSPEAMAALRTRLTTERDSGVLIQIRRALEH